MDEKRPQHADGWLLCPPTGAHIVDSGAARWWAEAGGLVCNQSYVRHVTVEHLRAGFQAARALADGRRVALVAESGPLSETTREARQELAGAEAASVFCAMAVLVRSPVARTIMNFFVRFSSPPFPVRVFSTASDARAWAARQVATHSAGRDD